MTVKIGRFVTNIMLAAGPQNVMRFLSVLAWILTLVTNAARKPRSPGDKAESLAPSLKSQGQLANPMCAPS